VQQEKEQERKAKEKERNRRIVEGTADRYGGRRYR